MQENTNMLREMEDVEKIQEELLKMKNNIWNEKYTTRINIRLDAAQEKLVSLKA